MFVRASSSFGELWRGRDRLLGACVQRFTHTAEIHLRIGTHYANMLFGCYRDEHDKNYIEQ